MNTHTFAVGSLIFAGCTAMRIAWQGIEDQPNSILPNPLITRAMFILYAGIFGGMCLALAFGELQK
jgi:hypothetical protein